MRSFFLFFFNFSGGKFKLNFVTCRLNSNGFQFHLGQASYQLTVGMKLMEVVWSIPGLTNGLGCEKHQDSNPIVWTHWSKLSQSQMHVHHGFLVLQEASHHLGVHGWLQILFPMCVIAMEASCLLRLQARTEQMIIVPLFAKPKPSNWSLDCSSPPRWVWCNEKST